MTYVDEALDRARDLIMAAEYEPAATVLREHLAGHPDDATAWQQLATALTRLIGMRPYGLVG